MTIHCSRCGLERERQAFKPFPNEMGQRIFDTICRDCWAEWLKSQQQLINHYALVPHQPKSKEFLLRNMEQFLLVKERQTGCPDPRFVPEFRPRSSP